jgi:hypothetical protein
VGNAEVDGAPAAVDEATRGQDPGAPATNGLDHLPGGATGRDHVLDHDEGLGLFESEAPSERHRPVLTLGEQAPAAEGPSHLVGHEDPAEGRGHHRGRRRVAEKGAETIGQGRTKRGGDPGVHEDACALEIARGVKPRREEEMALEESSALLEQAEEADVGVEVVLFHGDRS